MAGEPIDNHVHMTWAAMTIEVNEWADDYPEIVDLADVGKPNLKESLGCQIIRLVNGN